jgi:hypothetical protein
VIFRLVSKRYAKVYDLQEYAVFIALCNIALTCVRKYDFKYSLQVLLPLPQTSPQKWLKQAVFEDFLFSVYGLSNTILLVFLTLF